MTKPYTFANPVDGFLVHNTDTSGVVRYYGYVDISGGWYIMKEDATTDTAIVYTFTVGTTDYSTSWTGRAGLTYTAVNVAFA